MLARCGGAWFGRPSLLHHPPSSPSSLPPPPLLAPQHCGSGPQTRTLSPAPNTPPCPHLPTPRLPAVLHTSQPHTCTPARPPCSPPPSLQLQRHDHGAPVCPRRHPGAGRVFLLARGQRPHRLQPPVPGEEGWGGRAGRGRGRVRGPGRAGRERGCAAGALAMECGTPRRCCCAPPHRCCQLGFPSFVSPPRSAPTPLFFLSSPTFLPPPDHGRHHDGEGAHRAVRGCQGAVLLDVLPAPPPYQHCLDPAFLQEAARRPCCWPPSMRRLGRRLASAAPCWHSSPPCLHPGPPLPIPPAARRWCTWATATTSCTAGCAWRPASKWSLCVPAPRVRAGAGRGGVCWPGVVVVWRWMVCGALATDVAKAVDPSSPQGAALPAPQRSALPCPACLPACPAGFEPDKASVALAEAAGISKISIRWVGVGWRRAWLACVWLSACASLPPSPPFAWRRASPHVPASLPACSHDPFEAVKGADVVYTGAQAGSRGPAAALAALGADVGPVAFPSGCLLSDGAVLLLLLARRRVGQHGAEGRGGLPAAALPGLPGVWPLAGWEGGGWGWSAWATAGVVCSCWGGVQLGLSFQPPARCIAPPRRRLRPPLLAPRRPTNTAAGERGPDEGCGASGPLHALPARRARH